MRSRARVFILVFALVLAVAGLVSGQTGTTLLRGIVIDLSGVAIANAKVTLTSTERGFARTAETNASGGYEFLQI